MTDQVVLTEDEVKRIVSQFIAKQKKLDPAIVEIEHVSSHQQMVWDFTLTASYTVKP